MQQTSGVAIVATHLATTDRRALSQAWYSALHLARRPALAHRDAAPHTAVQRPQRPHADAAAIADRRRDAAVARTAPSQTQETAARTVHTAGVERRAPASELARRIERTVTRRLAARMPASFAVSAADGRVHVLVRSDGNATRIVAVCAPALRAHVERALAQARFALAARGVRTEAA